MMMGVVQGMKLAHREKMSQFIYNSYSTMLCEGLPQYEDKKLQYRSNIIVLKIES